MLTWSGAGTPSFERRRLLLIRLEGPAEIRTPPLRRTSPGLMSPLCSNEGPNGIGGYQTLFEVVPLAIREHSWHAIYSEENEIAFYRLTRHPLVPLQILISRFKRSCSRVSLNFFRLAPAYFHSLLRRTPPITFVKVDLRLQHVQHLHTSHNCLEA